MPHSLSSARFRVLLIRVMLSSLFAYVLTRLFFPAATIWTIIILAGLLLFFAYAFEYLRKK
jgi:hypothetical protein